MAADRAISVVTPERFATGMTFAQYIRYIGTSENLAREAGSWLGPTRRDWSGPLLAWFEGLRLGEPQVEAIRWLVAQPKGPGKILMISEKWSSDCRRDVPMLARRAEAGPLEMRIFPRDGQEVGREPTADMAQVPNADIMNEFLREADGRTYQSISVAVFYTRELEYLYHYTEFPAIYHKESHRPGRARVRSRHGNASSGNGGRCSSRPSSRCGPPRQSTRCSPSSTSEPSGLSRR